MARKKKIEENTVDVSDITQINVENMKVATVTTIRTEPIRIYRTDPNVPMPSFGTAQSACFDIAYCSAGKTYVQGFDAYNDPMDRAVATDGSIEIFPGERLLLPTGLIFDIMPEYYLVVYMRSSVGLKRGLRLSNGTGIIDPDYFDETRLLIQNTSKTLQTIENNTRLCQGELRQRGRYELPETFDKPGQTTDRTGGLGSTGT
jgi:dUTP pyrophosphatase